MTVDSEAIFALMELRRNDSRALSELRGTMAAAWMDEREPETLFLARGRARPLWLGRTPTELFFASTRRALAIVEAALRTRLDVTEVREGRLVRVVDGRVDRQRRFRADRRYREEKPYSPVTAPREAVSCLVRLDALASG
jgi:asparagine synthetase B (glutamine-hydrolysing)